MANNIFPIQPTFITRIKEYDENSSDRDGLNDFNLNDHGVFGQDLIHGFLAVISHEEWVKAPITFYEFIPKELHPDVEADFQKKVENKEIRILQIKNASFKSINEIEFIESILKNRNIIRTDNENHYGLKNSCSCFRRFLINKEDKQGTRHCDELDYRVGLLALETLTEDNFEVELNSHIRQFNDGKDIDNGAIIIVSQKKGKIPRPFIYYRCPISGYFEIIFPIFHERKVVGCIMMGEALADDLSKEHIKSRFISFLNETQITLTSDELKDLKNKIKIDFEKENYRIENNDSIVINEANNHYKGIKIPIESNKELLKSIEKKIANLERRLRKRVNLYRQRYIAQKFLEIKQEFQDEALNQISNKHNFNVYNLSKIIEKSLSKIVEYFPNTDGFIRIFMADTGGEEKKLKILAASDRAKLNNSNEYIFDLSCIPDEIINYGKDVSNKDKIEKFTPEFLKSLEKGLFFKGKEAKDLIEANDIIRYYPTLASKVCFVIWKRYSDDFRDNSGFFDIYRNAMIDFYTTIAANYAALWGSQRDKNLIDVIRITSHESGQIIPRIERIIHRNLITVEKLRRSIKNGFLFDKINDIITQLELLTHLLDKPAILFENIELEYETIDLKKEFFYKLRNLYMDDANLKGISFLIKEFEQNNEIQADRIYLSHLINNIIDNAVKYCNRGTCIQMYTLKSENELNIHIISFGPKIPSGERIYNLYERIPFKEKKEGLGIGCYIAKNIAEAHKGKITHCSTPISKYQVGCIAYLNEEMTNEELVKLNDNLTLEEIEGLILEYNKILDKGYTKKEIFAYTHSDGLRFKPKYETFLEQLSNETYKNEFIIKLPKSINYENTYFRR